MHTSKIINLLLGLGAGALAFPATQISPTSLLKRDFTVGNISIFAATDCSGVPIKPTFQDSTAVLKPGKCLPFGADPDTHIDIHWGSVPNTTAVQFWYPTENKDHGCTGDPMANIIYRDHPEQEFDCSTFTSTRGPAGFVTFITWPLFSQGS